MLYLEPRFSSVFYLYDFSSERGFMVKDVQNNLDWFTENSYTISQWRSCLKQIRSYSPNQYLPSDDRSPLAELSPLADCMKGPARSFPELCPGAGGRFTNSTAWTERIPTFWGFN